MDRLKLLKTEIENLHSKLETLEDKLSKLELEEKSKLDNSPKYKVGEIYHRVGYDNLYTIIRGKGTYQKYKLLNITYGTFFQGSLAQIEDYEASEKDKYLTSKEMNQLTDGKASQFVQYYLPQHKNVRVVALYKNHLYHLVHHEGKYFFNYHISPNHDVNNFLGVKNKCRKTYIEEMLKTGMKIFNV